MAAGNYDILIEQGATFLFNITYKNSAGTPINLTGYTARMQVRQKYSSPTTLLSFTSAGGNIVLGGAAGTIAVTGSADATAGVAPCCGVYDLELISPSGIVTRLVSGVANITPEVTRAGA